MLQKKTEKTEAIAKIMAGILSGDNPTTISVCPLTFILITLPTSMVMNGR
jgi:hypothetical protein